MADWPAILAGEREQTEVVAVKRKRSRDRHPLRRFADSVGRSRADARAPLRNVRGAALLRGQAYSRVDKVVSPFHELSGDCRISRRIRYLG
jgi:hypothetical protein